MSKVKKVSEYSIYIFLTLLGLLVIYYDSININLNLDLYLKILILLTSGLCLLVYGWKKNTFVIFSLVILMYILSLISAQWTSEFTLFESISAIASFTIGIVISRIRWKDEHKSKILLLISFLPLFSVVIGLILWPFGVINFLGRNNTALAGAALSTNLSFFGVIGIMASLLFFYKYNKVLFRYIAYLNFIIVFLTLTRGGILAGFVVIVPDAVKFAKDLIKSLSRKQLVIYTSIALLALIPIGYASILLIQRSFLDGEFISSGRFEAWPRILEHVTNMWSGRGYGYLKTVTDPALKYFIAAHNEYLRLYLETGIIGLGLIIIMFVLIFYKPFKVKSNKFKVLYISVLISFLIYSLVDNTLTNFRYWVPFMSFVSVME